MVSLVVGHEGKHGVVKRRRAMQSDAAESWGDAGVVLCSYRPDVDDGGGGGLT